MAIEHCRVVLLRTHYPGNLGAVARIMHNYGLHDLVLVQPLCNRDDRLARQMSTHGEHILESARIFATLTEAVGDCVLVIGTSGPAGGLFRRQSVGPPDAILREAVGPLQERQRIALVFGPEPTGLANEEVTRCHYLIHIPTAAAYTSLNLAQAVAICLYELHCQLGTATPRKADPPLAAVAEQERMFAQLRLALEEIHFLYGPKAEALMHAVRHLLGKARLTTMEVKILLGLARQIRWFVAHGPRTMTAVDPIDLDSPIPGGQDEQESFDPT
ncbi:MAG: RNA methyltransferase [Gemmataceae bacterium]|nr:RNA methyltransferase [Gemmataceae bacterium]